MTAVVRRGVAYCLGGGQVGLGRGAHVERSGSAGLAVCPGHGVRAGRGRGAGRAGAAAVRCDRERGRGGDVTTRVAEGVLALRGIGLGAAGVDRRGGRGEHDPRKRARLDRDRVLGGERDGGLAADRGERRAERVNAGARRGGHVCVDHQAAPDGGTLHREPHRRRAAGRGSDPGHPELRAVRDRRQVAGAARAGLLRRGEPGGHGDGHRPRGPPAGAR